MTDISPTPIQITIYKSERAIRRLHELIKSTYAKRDKSTLTYKAWQDACANFHKNSKALVFSCEGYTGEQGLVELLNHNDANGDYAREFAVCFIEIRPYYFRSGYLYKKLLRKLNHAPLTPNQRQRYDKVKSAYREYRLNRNHQINKQTEAIK